MDTVKYSLTEKSQGDNYFLSLFQGTQGLYRRADITLRNFLYEDIQTIRFGIFYVWSGPTENVKIENFMFKNTSSTRFLMEIRGHSLVRLENTTLENCSQQTHEVFHIYGAGDIEIVDLAMKNLPALASSAQAAEIRTVSTGKMILERILFENVKVISTPFFLISDQYESLSISSFNFTDFTVSDDQPIFNILEVSTFSFSDSYFNKVQPVSSVDSGSRLINFETIDLERMELSTLRNLTIENSILSLFTTSNIMDYTALQRSMTLEDIQYID